MDISQSEQSACFNNIVAKKTLSNNSAATAWVRVAAEYCIYVVYNYEVAIYIYIIKQHIYLGILLYTLETQMPGHTRFVWQWPTC